MFPAPLVERLSLTFAGAGRPVLVGLAELDREIGRATAPDIDHGVAHARLAWWRSELERTHAGTAVHPLTRRLAASAPVAVDWRWLFARVTVAELALAGRVPSAAREFEAYCAGTHGAPWAVAAQLLAPGVAGAAEYGAELGGALGLAGALAAAESGRGLPVAELAPLAIARLARADRALPAAGRRALAAALVAGALAREMAASAPLAPRAFMQPWIAWRAARGALKESP